MPRRAFTIRFRLAQNAERQRVLAAMFLALLLSAAATAGRSEESAERQPFRVAAVQFNPELGTLEENVASLAQRFEEAARAGARIAVAPEMATTGYLYLNRSDIAEVVEPIPGPTTRRFGEIARRHGCYLVWGMPERDAETDLYYNSAAIVGPEGYIGKYRKTHLWESEAHWAVWGDLGIPVFPTRFGRVALLICQDANYVETFRLAALGGADLVCFATNSSGQTIGHLQARAIQNGIYVVSANRSDSEVDPYDGESFRMRGCSAIWSPVGEKLAEAEIDQAATVYACVDPADFAIRRERLAERRPETYLALARHVAPWNDRATEKPRWIEAIVVQYGPAAGKPEENRAIIEQMLAERLGGKDPSPLRRQPASAAVPDARLIVLPELSLLGQAPPEVIREYAEPRGEGTAFAWAAVLARRFHAFVVCGYPQRQGQRVWNAAMVLDPEGKAVGHARKVHLNAYDRQWASAGNRWTVLRNESLGRLGILIGSDSYVPEAGTVMAIRRADVVAVPASWHGEIAGDGAIAINPAINPHAARGAMVLWDEMAWCQQFFTVAANTASTCERPGGRSGVYSTDPIYGIESEAFAGTDRAKVVISRFRTLNGNYPEHWITQGHYIASRRPGSLYHALIESRAASHDAVPSVPAISGEASRPAVPLP